MNTAITPSTLNELRFQSREDRPRFYSGPSLPGQSRRFPDTGIDFGGQYRFGLPFFIPVQDHDSRVQGFMNYVNIGPTFVECSNGTTNNNGTCPAGTSITGPLDLFLQFAGVGGKTVDQAQAGRRACAARAHGPGRVVLN